MVPKNPTVEDLALIYEQFGEAVARRAFYYTCTPRDERDWTNFFACIPGKDDPLPEYDPSGFSDLYRNHPADKPFKKRAGSALYCATDGASAHWFNQLVGASETFGKWVILFLYETIVLEKDIELWESIGNDEGEADTVEDQARFCTWFPAWRGWTRWAESLTRDDVIALSLVLKWVFRDEFKHKWPNPGTPEAAELVAKMREK